ncbi:Crp/Fnr family transcriptional regulator [Gorillibacterium massiliense]|uniref:Crp/Fnr family transcriptional regulator n=1 Tax=Gorillibacterium massiliense TaxID=1280390 RepID=UPI0004BC1FD4|nr:Crp/Fnr family transcriptional regulator [Gorillibacterium massiliense]
MNDNAVNHEELLRLVPLFRDLSKDELERIWSISIQRTYRKRAVVFTEGADKESVFFIQKGLVKAYKTDESGHEHIISYLRTGDMFPHTGFFNHDPYPATTKAIVESRILAIPVRSFEALMMDVPAIAVKVMRVMSEKIRELQDNLQKMTGQDVQDRGVSFLVKLAEDYGTERNGKIRIDIPMTNQDFANVVGTTRESINRLITQLRKDDLIETNRSGFIILDLDGLRNWTHK